MATKKKKKVQKKVNLKVHLAFPCTDNEMIRYNEYFKFCRSFDIHFTNNYEDLQTPVKQIQGYVVAQNEFFRWLDMSMLMAMWIQGGDYNAEPIQPEDALDFRLNIQDLHMDHVLDILLFAVGQTEDAFEKPYQLSNYNNDLVFNHKHKEIMAVFFHVWEEYNYLLQI